MIFDRSAIRQRALPLAMIAVSLCLLVTGWLYSITLVFPGVFYLGIGLRGLMLFRAGHQNHSSRNRHESSARGESVIS